jgi:hypothetical protein
MGNRRKVFICRDCEGVYADHMVSRCDCLGAEIYDEAEIVPCGSTGELLAALEQMCAEFRGYDLPYGSEAYTNAISVINRVKAGE